MLKKNFNPFYALLILVGIAFCITAFAYGIMTLRGLQPADSLGGSQSGKQLMHWVDQNGFGLLMGELAALAVLTFSAIATDEYWTKREAKPTKTHFSPENPDDHVSPPEHVSSGISGRGGGGEGHPPQE